MVLDKKINKRTLNKYKPCAGAGGAQFALFFDSIIIF